MSLLGLEVTRLLVFLRGSWLFFCLLLLLGRLFGFLFRSLASNLAQFLVTLLGELVLFGRNAIVLIFFFSSFL